MPQKQWQKTFERVINDIHACQEAAKSAVIKKIYRQFKPEKDEEGKPIEDTSFRQELCRSLNSLEWRSYPLLHRWLRQAYHRGHTWVNNQLCVGVSGNGATVKRTSRNVVAVTISGDQIGKRKYEKLTLKFKVGRCTPTGLFQIIFDDVTGEVRLYFPQVVKRSQASGTGQCGLDKGYTEAFTDSQGTVYGDGIGKVMQSCVEKRHVRGRARNKLYQIAQKKNKPQIHRCNLGKKRWNRREQRKKQTLRAMVRQGINQFFHKYQCAITEDLSFVVKNKYQAKKVGGRAGSSSGTQRPQPLVNRNLSQWCKGLLQQSLDEIATRRQSEVRVVNAAYTSQVDSRNGTLLGQRRGDQFFTFDGEVLQADSNAARNIEARQDDSDISRFMKSVEVRKVLIKRTVSFLLARDLTLQDAINAGWFDPRHLKEIGKKAGAESEALVA